jgi:hypothetical protein
MDLSRAMGPSLHIGAAGNGFRTCTLRRPRHRNLVVVPSAIFTAGGPCHLALKRGCPLRISWRPLRCQGNDSLAFVDGPLEGTEGSSEANDNEATGSTSDDHKEVDVDGLREALNKSNKDLEVARLNSTMFEEKAQRISESAIALKDRADGAQRDVSEAVAMVQDVISKEADAKEAVQKATMALSMAKARLQLAAEAMEAKRGSAGQMEDSFEGVEEEAFVSAQGEIKDCQASLSKCEEELTHIQERKMELQSDVDRLTELAETALLDASKAEEDVANIMVLAEQAVAIEMEAAQHVNDAELVLQKAISSVDTAVDLPPLAEISEHDHDSELYEFSSDGIYDISDRDEVSSIERLMVGDLAVEGIEKLEPSREISDQVSSDKHVEPQREPEPEIDKPSKQGKKHETERKEPTKGPLSAPKALLKRSSRFFSASFFSSKADGEFTPTSVFQGLMASVRKQAPKLVIGVLLLGAG